MESTLKRHYIQGGYDYDFVDELDRKYECPICLLCLRDPHQTSCGHRFCYSCILTWLGEGRTCPHDNSSLGEGDIYADNGINRDILQLKVRCPRKDCTSVMRICDMPVHLRACTADKPVTPGLESDVGERLCPDCGEAIEFSSQHTNIVCPRVLVACPFSLVGCSQKIQRSKLKEHVEGQTVHHMQLLTERLLKIQQLGTAVDTADQSSDTSFDEGVSGLGASPLSRNTVSRGSNTKLIRESCQRIIELEQTICQLQIRIDQLEPLADQQLQQPAHQLPQLPNEDLKAQFCNGNFLWKIPDFGRTLEQMRRDTQFVQYSRPFCTSVYGYRMRLRCNVVSDEEKGEQHLALFIHLMRGENDDYLDWPFRGSVNLTLLNQNTNSMLLREHLTEYLECTDSLEAFQRPTPSTCLDASTVTKHPQNFHSSIRNRPSSSSSAPSQTSIKGFGFREFIRVNALFTGGFVKDDKLVVRAKVYEEN